MNPILLEDSIEFLKKYLNWNVLAAEIEIFPDNIIESNGQ